MRNIRQINERNQITLPAGTLKSVGLKHGDYLEVEARGAELILKPKKVEDVFSDEDWDSLDELVRRQVKAKDYTEYSSVSRAMAHFKRVKK